MGLRTLEVREEMMGQMLEMENFVAIGKRLMRKRMAEEAKRKRKVGLREEKKLDFRFRCFHCFVVDLGLLLGAHCLMAHRHIIHINHHPLCVLC